MKPSEKLQNLPIRYKFLIVFIGVFTLTLSLASFVTYTLVRITIEKNIESELANTNTSLVNIVGNAANGSIRNYLRAIAEKNLDIVRYAYNQYEEGRLTERQAKELSTGMLLCQAIGKTGYIYVLNSRGVLDVHPKELLRGANISQYTFIQEQIRRKHGYLEYEWKNPGETKERPKALYMTYFKPWDWIISASSYRGEFKHLVNAANLRDSILSVRFGKTGYPFIIDSHGTFIIHPKLEGKNSINAKDADGRLFIKEICERKHGKIIYPWQNPGEPFPRQKLVFFDYIPEFDWIVASSSYLEEFYAPLATLRYTIIATFIAAVALVSLFTFQVSGTVTKPLQQLMEKFSAAAAGNLSVRLQGFGRDEVGQLGRFFNELMGKLEAEIQERLQAEKALKKSEQTMVDIIDFLPDATVVIDQESKVIAWNHAMEQMTGVNAPSVLGKGNYAYALPFYGERRPILIDLVTVPDKEIEDKYAHIERRGKILFGECYADALPTGKRYLFATAVALHDPQGRVVGAIESIRDITERKQTEDELQKYQIHLEEIVNSRTAALKTRTNEALMARQAAETANKAKSTFLANMSHELRTPLNAVLGFSELMMRDPQLSADQRENLKTINKSGDHLLAIINDVLEMSKIEAGHTELSLNSFNLHSLIDSVQDMFRLLAGRKGLDFIVQGKRDVPEFIRGDEAKLRQILINLLANAVKFTSEGQILLRLRKQSEQTSPDDQDHIQLCFEVEDTGPGIPQKDSPQLFEAFYQTEFGQYVQGGTGLGLTISRNFVQLMGGDISVISPVKDDRGTCFTFQVMVEKPAAEEVASLQPKSRQLVTGIMPGQPQYRILVVDDKESNRRLLDKILKPLNCMISEVTNGKDALEAWRTFQPHLIWMDLRMPIMDGYEATRLIRKMESEQLDTQEKPSHGPKQVKRTVIIAISASALEIRDVGDLSEDFDDFLKKPFREAEFYTLLQKHLHLQYTYAEHDTHLKDDAIDLAYHLRGVPPDLLAKLQESLEMSDAEEIETLLGMIAESDSALADALLHKADNFEYDTILDMITQAGQA